MSSFTWINFSNPISLYDSAITRGLPVDEADNIARGKKAMRHVIANQKDISHAMYRDDLGWIDFVWGDVGIVKPSGKTKGGKGIAHILEARQRKDGLTAMQARAQVLKLVEVIARGEVIRQFLNPPATQTVIEYDQHEAILVKNGARDWLLTGWKVG